MNYKLLATREGIRVLSAGDPYSLSYSAPYPQLFDADLIDLLPVQNDQKVVAVVAEPIYNLLLESKQIL